MAWVAKVNRHVTLMKFAGGTVKAKPGVITSIAIDGNPVIRVGRKGESYGNGTNGVPQRTNPDEDLTVTKFISY